MWIPNFFDKGNRPQLKHGRALDRSSHSWLLSPPFSLTLAGQVRLSQKYNEASTWCCHLLLKREGLILLHWTNRHWETPSFEENLINMAHSQLMSKGPRAANQFSPLQSQPPVQPASSLPCSQSPQCSQPSSLSYSTKTQSSQPVLSPAGWEEHADGCLEKASAHSGFKSMHTVYFQRCNVFP